MINIRIIISIFDGHIEKHESVVYSCRTNLGNSNAQRISSQLRRIRLRITAWYCSLFMCMVFLGPVLISRLQCHAFCIYSLPWRWVIKNRSMESLFFFVIALSLAYAVGCWGKQRKIGFWFAFILSLFNLFIGIIAVACSKKI